MASNGISFRPITDYDMEFLYRVFFSTRIDELALTNFSETEKENFLRLQFNAQHTHYQTHYSDSDFLIILQNNFSIGRIYLGRWEDQIRIVEIALLPENRNNGIGGKLIKDVMKEAEKENKSVSCHVEKNNPALRLYDRLGFKFVEDREVYLYLKWTPEIPAGNTD